MNKQKPQDLQDLQDLQELLSKYEAKAITLQEDFDEAEKSQYPEGMDLYDNQLDVVLEVIEDLKEILKDTLES